MQKQGATAASCTFKVTEEDKEETEEATASLDAAEETSTDAAIEAFFIVTGSKTRKRKTGSDC